MRRTYRAMLMVLGGLIGGALGYWLAVALDLGTRRGIAAVVVLAAGAGVVGVLLTGAAIALPPFLSELRLRKIGDAGTGMITDRWSLGMQINGPHTHLRLFGFVVELRGPDGDMVTAHATQWVTPDDLDRLVPGRRVVVRYDHDHPDHAIVDAPAQGPVAAG